MSWSVCTRARLSCVFVTCVCVCVCVCVCACRVQASGRSAGPCEELAELYEAVQSIADRGSDAGVRALAAEAAGALAAVLR